MRLRATGRDFIYWASPLGPLTRAAPLV